VIAGQRPPAGRNALRTNLRTQSHNLASYQDGEEGSYFDRHSMPSGLLSSFIPPDNSPVSGALCGYFWQIRKDRVRIPSAIQDHSLTGMRFLRERQTASAQDVQW
jgi:hypothetical protein